MASIRKRTNPSGKTVWRAEIRRKGFPPLSETYPTRALAQEWARKEERRLDEQRADPTAYARQHLIDNAIARYRDEIIPRKRPSTAYTQDQQLTWWLHQLTGKRLADVTGPVVADCLHSLTVEVSGTTGRPRSAATRNRYYAAINHLLNQCIEWGWLNNNPLRHVKKLPESEGRKRYLSSNGEPGDEKDRLLEACLQSRNSDLYDIVLFALCTGMRRGEIFGLRWKDILWVEREAVVRSETSKTKRMRHVPLVRQALEVLQGRNKVRDINDDHVFKSHNFRKAWERATRIAGLEDFKFHDLRHSCASYLVRAGVPLNVIGEILGHTQIGTTQRYAHIANDHLHESMSRMSDLLG